MKIYHTIEELSFLKDHISDSDRIQVIKLFTQEQWVKAADYFLKGISNQHNMIGKTVDTMRGICQYYYEHHNITWKQLTYLVANLIENWQEISYEYRNYATM